MHRTTLVLPPELKDRAAQAARTQGLSFGAFVRQAIEQTLASKSRKTAKLRDSLLDDHAVFRGPAPTDLAERHDRYLYGE